MIQFEEHIFQLDWNHPLVSWVIWFFPGKGGWLAHPTMKWMFCKPRRICPPQMRFMQSERSGNRISSGKMGSWRAPESSLVNHCWHVRMKCHDQGTKTLSIVCVSLKLHFKTCVVWTPSWSRKSLRLYFAFYGTRARFLAVDSLHLFGILLHFVCPDMAWFFQGYALESQDGNLPGFPSISEGLYTMIEGSKSPTKCWFGWNRHIFLPFWEWWVWELINHHHNYRLGFSFVPSPETSSI